MAPEEARRIKDLVVGFLQETHGIWNVSNVVITTIHRTQNQIEVRGTFDGGTIFQVKIVNFTIVLDSNYHLVSYERT